MISKETEKNILKFRDDRDWKKFHNGKDLAISISLEANELLECFQWSSEDVDRLSKIDSIKEELADVLIYCQMMSDYYSFDMDEIINTKLIKNLNKYPEGEFMNLKTREIENPPSPPNSRKLADWCLNNLNLDAEHYAEPYKSLGPCILDCIYSLQAKYFSVVVPLMERYGERYMNGDVHAEGYTLDDFISHIREAGGTEPFSANILKNRQVLCGRRKSEVCLEIADKLISLGIQTKEDFSKSDKNEIENAIRGVKGVGDAAANYLFMLAGDSSRVKPDVHIHHCIRDAIGFDVSNEECQTLFTEAVDIIREVYPNVTVASLDGLVWNRYRS